MHQNTLISLDVDAHLYDVQLRFFADHGDTRIRTIIVKANIAVLTGLFIRIIFNAVVDVLQRLPNDRQPS